ncbi:MAG: AEC family transporter [Actinobacteria bacterium]|nr:AEC family transporter [Actinomycetota bacterium]
MFDLLNLILGFVLIIALGFIGKKTGLLEEKDRDVVNKVIIYFTLPALIFIAVLNSKPTLALFKIPVLAFFVAFLCGIIAFVIGKILKLNPKTFGAFLIASTIGNTGYLGFPLTQKIYGNENLIKAIFYDFFGTVVLILTVGVYIAEIYGEYRGKEASLISSLKEILFFPSLWALVLGLGLKSILLPNFLLSGLESLASATIPLIMFSVGLSLRLEGIREYKILLFFLCLIKLIISPFTAYLFGQVLQMNKEMLGISVLEASMPTVILSLAIGTKYKLDLSFLATAILVTTLLSIVTIMFWQYII